MITKPKIPIPLNIAESKASTYGKNSISKIINNIISIYSL